MIDLSKIELKDFANILGSEMVIHAAERKNVLAEIAEVTALEGYSPLERTPFSLVIKTKDQNVYPQQIFEVIHQQYGSIAIFFTPIKKDNTGVSYNAIFS